MAGTATLIVRPEGAAAGEVRPAGRAEAATRLHMRRLKTGAYARHRPACSGRSHRFEGRAATAQARCCARRILLRSPPARAQAQPRSPPRRAVLPVAAPRRPAAATNNGTPPRAASTLRCELPLGWADGREGAQGADPRTGGPNIGAITRQEVEQNGEQVCHVNMKTARTVERKIYDRIPQHLHRRRAEGHGQSCEFRACAFAACSVAADWNPRQLTGKPRCASTKGPAATRAFAGTSTRA